MYLTYRYRIKDRRHKAELCRMARAANQVWNYCGEIQEASRRFNRHWPTAYDLMKLTTGSSKLLGLHSDVIGTICKKFAIARDRAHRRPRWRASKGPKRSLGWIPFRHSRFIGINGDCAIFMKRQYKLWLSRPIGGEVKFGCFSEDASGRWYLNLVCEVSDELLAGNSEIGIDLGLKDFAALSTGETISNPRHLRKSAAKLAKAQRAGRKKLARKIHRKVAAQRRHFLHEISTRIARENKLVCIGDVNSAGLARTRMAKAVFDAGWSTFRNQLRYKAMRHGAAFIEVNEAYSTQTCSDCGFRIGSPKGVKDLRVRSWECGNCGSVHDRDVNAAINILRSGRNAVLQATGIAPSLAA